MIILSIIVSLFFFTNVSSFSRRFLFVPTIPSKIRLNNVYEYLKTSEQPENLPRITVRFINTLDGRDVIVDVEEGSNLLIVGDNAGVKLPRACRTGLCGSCTCEVQDPAAIATSTNPRDGFATIRACSTKCFVPADMDEMVVDVQRMRKKAGSGSGTVPEVAGSIGSLTDTSSYNDPLARFSGDWEKEFRPQWESASTALSKGMGQVGVASDPRSRVDACAKCKGVGRIVCYGCHGSGRGPGARMVSKAGIQGQIQCATCNGTGNVGCGYCQGTGTGVRSKKPKEKS